MKFLVILLTFLFVSSACPQPLDVPRDVYLERSRQQGDRIRFCINADSMLSGFDAALAREIAATLLLASEIVPVKPPRPVDALDIYLPMSPEDIYILLAERCEAFMGFTFAQGYPEWLLLSRPYLTTRTVLATIQPGARSLIDIPIDRPIGTQILTGPDNQFLQYLQTLPEKDRWRRFPYYTNSLVLDRLFDGTLGAALIWEPALMRGTSGDPTARGVRILAAPVDFVPIDIGIGLRAADSFLNVTLGQAIDLLRRDGAVDRLLREHALTAPNLERRN